MKILYIGNFEPEFSTENDVRKAFEFLGHEVVCLQENSTTIPRVYGEAMKSDLLLITGTWDNALPLVDMINIYKACAEVGTPTATLHLDTFWGKDRRGRQWWLHPMFHTAYIFTADGDYEKAWELFGKNHIWLPPAIRHDAAHFGKFREEYACDVAFVGSNGVGYHEDVWPYRKELLNQLRTICKHNGWSFKNPGGDDPKISRGEDMNDFLASAKVTVGDSLCLKKEDSKYWSDRVPETTGRGGFLIMPKIHAIKKEWQLPTYDWGNWENLESNIEHYLNDPVERERIKFIDQNHTRARHTYVNRVLTILQMVGLR